MIKFVSMMLVLLLLDSSIMEVITNLNENACDPHASCDSSIIIRLAYIKKSTLLEYREIMRICGFVGQLLLLVYFRDVQNVMSKTLDERNCTLSDYSIQIEGIPQGYGANTHRIKNILTQSPITSKKLIFDAEERDEVHDSIQDVLLVQDLSEYFALEKELKGVVGKKIERVNA